MPTLDFKGKSIIYSHHLTVPSRPLRVQVGKSLPPKGKKASLDDNLVIHGDNLHALKALLPRYAGKVNCIYIDPPYNTGNEKWVYNDNVNSPMMQEWLKDNGPVDGEDMERHDKWLCMMWPRLQLLRELLAEDGVIFVSIDDNEQSHLRVMMNEIFEEENFVADFIWHHRKSSQNDIDISLSHNYILCYALHRSRFSFNPSEVDEGKFSNPDNDPRGPWVADPMDAPHVRENLTYEIVNPNTGKSYWPPSERHWRFSKELFQKALDDNRILFGKTGKSKPQYKRFLSEARERGTNLFTIWSDVGTATHATKELQRIFQRKQSFSTPKPTDLLEKIIRASTDQNGIVLDSFAGSGTTAHAVLALNKEDGGNRKFILVECEGYADKVTAERIRRVIKGVKGSKDESLKAGLGGSFTYCAMGDEMSIESMLKGKNLPDYETLARHIFWTATGQSPDKIRPQAQRGEDGFFCETDNRIFYLIYEPTLTFLRNSNSALNGDRAERIEKQVKAKKKTAVVYATHKFIGQKELTQKGITFCGLPYQINGMA